MAVQTPIANSLIISLAGDQRMIIAKFASVANNDTYVVPLGVITGLSIDSGNSATTAATWSGSTVTFAIGSGPATNVPFIAFGY